MSAAGLMRSVISAQTHIVSVCMQPLSALPFLPIIFLPPGLSLRYDIAACFTAKKMKLFGLLVN